MKQTVFSLGLAISAATLVVGCATTTPPELIDARSTYDRISNGPIAQANPAGVYEAKKSLERANREFAQHPNAPSTRDFAYLALRKAQLAEADAHIATDRQQKAQADRMIQEAQAKSQRRTLAQTRNQLTQAEREKQADAERLAQANAELQKKNEQLESERQARLDAEKRTEEVRRQLANVAQVRDDQRGLVITLAGSSLFPSSRSTLLPGARARLDRVADALSKSNQKVLVEGYTDSRGSNALNQGLSERRAQAVRDYLVQRGIPPERINAVGFGKSRPVADNGTPEGRANNRRVEIVIQRAEGPPNRG